ncbi:imidazolonepropionase [Pseudobacteriovorax antillogorgiicola]|uniref:Imidazolonepropionase n=1 Tax=Pseudobacteriovorax antillogorgiicola TaxID=1513793 RepID=A0A1Y6B7C4_9BACT|nr:imidazolonepropionase [Pseudobacteriovorax antillogorgiicola]TCS58811.1 imidazolonepropionase [Pseudobacteriovorax antillogorgiicola]SME94438.1 imidazolonepropionase [Pseudobacteriovorax antillogorgiicola]
MSQLLVTHIGELVSLAPLAKEQRCTQIVEQDLGVLSNAWLAIEDGKVLKLGSGPIPEELQGYPKLNAGGGLVLPGLVDCHTHPIFGGDRSHEFAARLSGKTYQDIAAEGGGIQSTIRHSRTASDTELDEGCRRNLKRFLEHGVTTVECKSGYGQSPQEEIRMLRILKKLAEEGPQTLSITYLGLHAKAYDYQDKTHFIEEMTAALKTIQADNLAEWVDAFVERGYFEVEDCERFFSEAQRLGFKIRIHADEFADSRAAGAAAQWQAYSADHLEEASVEGIKAMADSGVVAVLLPGTSIYSKIKFAQAQGFLDQNCAVALATDFNPGSCQIDNLPLIASLGALHCGLSCAQAIAAVSFVAAKSLGLSECKGALAPGYDGDFIIHPLQSKEQWIADFGRHKPSHVFLNGAPAISENPS